MPTKQSRSTHTKNILRNTNSFTLIWKSFSLSCAVSVCKKHYSPNQTAFRCMSQYTCTAHYGSQCTCTALYVSVRMHFTLWLAWYPRLQWDCFKDVLHKQSTTRPYRGIPLRFTWNLPSSGMLRSVGWLRTDVSRQPTSSIFKAQALDAWPLNMGFDKLSRNT